MRAIHIYLVVYLVLLVGALAALWRSGVLGQLPGRWVAAGLIIAVGLGVLLAVVSLPRRLDAHRD
jgi:peptidoglycan/LPS O-acetylase OafA/YrhL